MNVNYLCRLNISPVDEYSSTHEKVQLVEGGHFRSDCLSGNINYLCMVSLWFSSHMHYN